MENSTIVHLNFKLQTMPRRVLGLYDKIFWKYVQEQQMHLQCCSSCHKFHYPPGPICSHCLSENLEWKPVCGRAHIISWVVFHRGYLPSYPAPYNVITVRLAEGPLFISNLEGKTPDTSWIGVDVDLTYTEMDENLFLPRFKLRSV